MSKQRGEATVLSIYQQQSFSFQIFSKMVASFCLKRSFTGESSGAVMVLKKSRHPLQYFLYFLSSHQLSLDFAFSGHMPNLLSPHPNSGKLPIWLFYSSFWSDLAHCAIVDKHWSVTQSATGTGTKPAPGNKSLGVGGVSCIIRAHIRALQQTIGKVPASI